MKRYVLKDAENAVNLTSISQQLDSLGTSQQEMSSRLSEQDAQNSENINAIVQKINSFSSSQQEIRDSINEQDAQNTKNIATISKQLENLSTAQEIMSERLDKQLDCIVDKIEEIQDETENMQKRMQDDTRSYIIDKYRRFVCEKQCIDEVSLDDIERHYMYYSAANGDSYITNLMEKIRKLPIDVPETAIQTETE